MSEGLIDRRLARRRALQLAGVTGGLAMAYKLAVRPTSAQPVPPMFPQTASQLTRMAEDVWFWTNGGYNSLIVVSDGGALVTEPSSLNPRASTLLKNVVAFLTPQPVTYVVFSHDHADHNTGGDVFAETATFVSQQLAAPKIAARNDVRSPVPTVTFAQQMTLDLGGKAIELHYFGRNHSDNSLVLSYPARRLIHAVDWIETRRLPFRDLMDSYPDEWIAGLDRVNQLDFDVLVPGHTGPGSKQTVADLRSYWVDLMEAVKSAQAMGLPDNSPEMLAFVKSRLDARYSTWGSYQDFLPLNIQGLIRIWSTGV